jgi:hypothetical protein
MLDPKHGRRKMQRCEMIAQEDNGNEDLKSVVRVVINA